MEKLPREKQETFERGLSGIPRLFRNRSASCAAGGKAGSGASGPDLRGYTGLYGKFPESACEQSAPEDEGGHGKKLYGRCVIIPVY